MTEHGAEAALDWQAPAPWTEAVALTGKPIAIAALLAAEAGDTLPTDLADRVAKAFVAWLIRLGSVDLGDDFRSSWLRQMASFDDWVARLCPLLWRFYCDASSEEEREVCAQAAADLGVNWSVEQIAAALPVGLEWSAYWLGDALARRAQDRVLTPARVRALNGGPGSHLHELSGMLSSRHVSLREKAGSRLGTAGDSVLPIFVRAARRFPDVVHYLWLFLERRQWVLPAASPRASRSMRPVAGTGQGRRPRGSRKVAR